MSKVEIDKEDFIKLLNKIQKIAESALFNEGFDPHDWGKVENLVEEMTLKLNGHLFSYLVLFKKWTVVGNKFDKEE